MYHGVHRELRHYCSDTERTFGGGPGIGGSQTASEHFAPEKWALPHVFAYGSTTILSMCGRSSPPSKADLVNFPGIELSLDNLLPSTNETYSPQEIAWRCATILTPHAG